MKTRSKYKIEYKNELDEYHRLDGPAVEYTNGDKYWWVNGLRHREDGHAVEYINGYKAWYINGKYHREDGPAVEYASGDKEWFLNDIQYTEEEYNEELINLKLERLKIL